MGFWSKTFQFAKDVGVSVAESTNQQANELRELKDKCSGLDDASLFEILESKGVFGKSHKEKGVAFGELRRRGYDVQRPN